MNLIYTKRILYNIPIGQPYFYCMHIYIIVSLSMMIEHHGADALCLHCLLNLCYIK